MTTDSQTICDELNRLMTEHLQGEIDPVLYEKSKEFPPRYSYIKQICQLDDRYYRAIFRDDEFVTNSHILDLRQLVGEITHLYSDHCWYDERETQMMDITFTWVGKLRSGQYFYARREIEPDKTSYLLADSLEALKAIAPVPDQQRTFTTEYQIALYNQLMDQPRYGSFREQVEYRYSHELRDYHVAVVGTQELRTGETGATGMTGQN